MAELALRNVSPGAWAVVPASATYCNLSADQLLLLAERDALEPEVVLARECIAREGLVGATAEHLLAFARDLARRRVQ